LAADVKRRIRCTPIIDITDLRRIDELEEDSSHNTKVTASVLPYQERIYVPKVNLLCNKVISLLHDNQEFARLGALKTADVVSCDF